MFSMALRNPRASFSLTGIAQASRTGAAGDVAIGNTGSKDYGATYSGYCLTITGITNAASPVLTLLTGAVTANGTTVKDAGVDFEGRAVGLTVIKAILIERMDAGITLPVSVTGNAGTLVRLPGGQTSFLIATNDLPNAVLTDATLTLAMTAASEPANLRITVFGY